MRGTLEGLTKLQSMRLKSVSEIPENSRVILRLDADLPIENNVILDNSRLVKSLPTIKLLLKRNCKIVILGHRGRPFNKDLSLRPVYLELMALLENNGEDIISSVFIEDVNDTDKIHLALNSNNIVFIENLRFWSEEEKNDPNFLLNLVGICQYFVNDAFAVAHRKHASVMLCQKMETFYGLSFVEEFEKISAISKNTQRPITIILGGAKEDKLKYLPELEKLADYILVGGKLPQLIQNPSPASRDLPLTREVKLIVAGLNETGLDLSQKDIEKFKEIISRSKIIIWAGAMGYYESENNRKGTEEVAKMIANADAYKIIAGGDTSASIINLGLKDKIDYICSGGGVLLEYLAKGTLPAWD